MVPSATVKPPRDENAIFYYFHKRKGVASQRDVKVFS